MANAPDMKELETCVNQAYRYDFEQASRILEAMDCVRREAVRTHIPEIVTMVDSSFEVLRTTYHCILRNDKLPTVPRLERASADEKYDFGQAELILKAMNCLRKEAAGTNITEIVSLIDASFRLILTSYYCVLRFEMTKLPATSEETH